MSQKLVLLNAADPMITLTTKSILGMRLRSHSAMIMVTQHGYSYYYM